jgi:protein-L-isoaspartate(D-aspartate) O-methyltransferase
VTMLEELDLSAGAKVLEVGTGSGWNAACIARIVGPEGRVVSVELIEELVEFAKMNIRRARLEEIVEVHKGDGSNGWPPLSTLETYDRVVVTAGASSLPEVPLRQLRRGGVLLLPIGDTQAQILTKVTKGHDGRLSSRSLCPCIFVPLIRGEER